MRRFSLSLLTGALMLSGVTLATATTAVAEDSWLSDAWNSVKHFSVDQKDKVVNDSRIAMDKFDLQMDQLHAQASEDGTAMSEGWENTKSQLSDLRDKAQAKLDALGETSDDSWDSAKEDYGNAVQDLEDAYNKAASDLGS